MPPSKAVINILLQDNRRLMNLATLERSVDLSGILFPYPHWSGPLSPSSAPPFDHHISLLPLLLAFKRQSATVNAGNGINCKSYYQTSLRFSHLLCFSHLVLPSVRLFFLLLREIGNFGMCTTHTSGSRLSQRDT